MSRQYCRRLRVVMHTLCRELLRRRQPIASVASGGGIHFGFATIRFRLAGNLSHLVPLPAQLHLHDVQFPALAADPFDMLAGLLEPDAPISAGRTVVVPEHFQLNQVEAVPLERLAHDKLGRFGTVAASPTILLPDHDPEVGSTA